ncbi:MAG: BMP family ABC transporter substrate-binding protein [Oscillospiraceae bacterium]|jgi:basic membrane lipoprotein Med (substrate-binding protein (PBP1-ABC) superfamily)|nr:BMP family ABC transporter substrate-binding protein [Oscillospiraceae bacterium]
MKKILIALLCVIMMLGILAACGGGTGIDLEGIFTRDEEVDPFPLDTTVGFIYGGQAGSDPLIAIFELARNQLERTLGAETFYMESVRVLQFEEAVDKMVEAGANIIVASSNAFNSAVVLAARKHTDTYFISFGGADQAPNLASVQPLLFQAANVCGFTAAFNTYSNRVGIVADINMYNAYGIANAFALGVRELSAQVNVSLNWALSSHYDDTRAAILDLINQGCDIIFVYQSDEYGIRLLEELGVNVIGFAYNLPEIAPEHYITGMYLNLNTYLIDKVRNYMYGNTAVFGNHTQRGLLHGMVEMIGFEDSRLKYGTRDLADELRAIIMDGRSDVFGGEIRDRAGAIRVEKGSSLYITQIFTIRWLTNIIDTEKNFSEPLTDIILSDFKIRK